MMVSQHSLQPLAILFLQICLLFGGVVDAACNADNCLNAFNNGGGLAANSQFCSSFLATTYTATASGLGPFSTQCKNSPSRVSSACSCLMTMTSSSSKTKSSSTCTPGATITSTVYPSTCPTTGLSATPVTQTVTFVSVSTTTVTTTAPAASCTTCPQLVVNGGFETGDLSPWSDFMDDLGFSLSIAASSSIPGGSHSGSFSAAISGNNFMPGAPEDWYQAIFIPSQLCSSTQQYRFQAYVKTVGNTCYVNAYDNDSGAPFIDIHLQPGGPQPSWVEMSAVITPGAGPFQLTMEAACATSDTVWFDDITLTPF